MVQRNSLRERPAKSLKRVVVAGSYGWAAGLWLGVGTALERRTVVIRGVRIITGRLLLGLFGLAAQGRLIFCVGDLAGEHNPAQTPLYLIKFRSRNDVFLARGENARNFALRVLNALRGGRMRGKDFRDAARMPFFIGLQALEESHVGVRVVPRFVHILETKKVRLAFGVTREFQESEGYGHIH